MPPKKKKSNASKGPARGFATTSVPKKVAPVVEEPPAEEPIAEPEAAPESSEPTSSTAGLDPFQTRLQSLVDRFQDKVDRDVLRAIQVSRHASICYTSSNIERSSGRRSGKEILRNIVRSKMPSSQSLRLFKVGQRSTFILL